MLSLRSAPSPSGERTIVIAGTPRGGTTMVAECIANLGLPIGVPVPAPLEQFNYEDPEFVALLHREQPGPLDSAPLRQLISRRNEAHRIWGFKLPMALNSLFELEKELRNPVFVLVFRDVLAVSSREVIAVGAEAMQAMRRALRWQEQMVDFSTHSASPCLLISYEKALQFPKLLVDLLLSSTGLDADESLYQKALDKVAANREDYLRGVRHQCDVYGVPAPARA